jgi:ATP-dependent DNA helicase RecG
VAAVTGDRSKYIRNRAFDDAYYKDLVLKYLGKYGEAGRRDIDDVLTDKLSDVLSEPQKRSKIRNLLYAMSRRDATIQNIGSKKASRWILTDRGKENLALFSDKKI